MSTDTAPITEADLVKRIELHLAETGETETAFGKRVVRDGNLVRDLRNGTLVRNVTRKSARKLWHYAITQHEEHPAESLEVQWLGDFGLVSSYPLDLKFNSTIGDGAKYCEMVVTKTA